MLRPNLVERPHILGPGADFFTLDGQPVRPQPGAQTLQKVFSGSALDLNAMNGELLSDEENPGCTNGQQNRLVPTVSTILNQLSSDSEKEKAKVAKNKIQVLVIGENGYIASHVVAKLLQVGYTVRVTVSDAMNQQQQADLYGLGRDTAQRLSIVEADMTNSSALREAIRGCRYIIHCGCPTAGSGKERNPVQYHTEAVQALFDGIRLAGKATVKRVVLTGAATSVFNITEPTPASGKFDESCWNTVATAETDPVPYAKITFEKEAWRLRQMLGVELVVILPAITIGPSRTQETSETMVIIQGLANSPAYFPFCANLYWNFVDVRDVAEAHVRAMEAPEARDQRFIISAQCLCVADLGRIIARRFPHLTPPTRSANTLLTLLIGATQAAQGVNLKFLWRSLGVRKLLDTSHAVQELEMQFTDMEETVAGCVEQLMAAGEVPANSVASPSASSLWIICGLVTAVTATTVVLARALRKRS